jgi:hypothetical protein
MFPQDSPAQVLSPGKVRLRSGNDVTGAHAQIKQTSTSIRNPTLFTAICIRRLCASIRPLLAQIAILAGAAPIFDPLAALAQGLAVPTLVQHVATGMESNGVIDFIITLPNAALSGNCLILGIQYPSSGAITSVTDNQGNTWTEGPSTTNATYDRRMATYYALTVTAGTQVVTVAFSGLSGVSASSPPSSLV